MIRVIPEAEREPWLRGIEERAVEAYRALGLKATSGSPWGDKARCVVGVLYPDQVGSSDAKYSERFAYSKRIAEHEGTTSAQVDQFWLGFDLGISRSRLDFFLTTSDELCVGFAVALAVLGAGINDRDHEAF